MGLSGGCLHPLRIYSVFIHQQCQCRSCITESHKGGLLQGAGLYMHRLGLAAQPLLLLPLLLLLPVLLPLLLCFLPLLPLLLLMCCTAKLRSAGYRLL